MALTSRFPVSQQLVGLFAWVALTYLAAALGAVASINAGEFYTQLTRPAWAPPPYLFGPVWTLLYTLMGVAAWLVWRAEGFAVARGALALFIVQLVLNALWSCLFFGLQQGALAFAEILLLWLAILATLIAFWRVLPAAGALLLPYLLWVSFAAVLNFSLWQLNPRILG